MGSYNSWVGESFRITELWDPTMVGLEGIVEPQNPIMVGVGETFRIMEPQNPTIVGLEGITEPWNPIMVGLERPLGSWNCGILQ